MSIVTRDATSGKWLPQTTAGIKANPTLPAGALVPDVPGALGLPMVGV